MWQHICFSIDTQTKLWMFYKDGLMTDIGVASVSPFSSDALSLDDNVIYLGRPLSKVSSSIFNNNIVHSTNIVQTNINILDNYSISTTDDY